jgi:hypothetical protein
VAWPALLIKLVDGGHVEPVRNVEDQLHVVALAEIDPLRDAQVIETPQTPALMATISAPEEAREVSALTPSMPLRTPRYPKRQPDETTLGSSGPEEAEFSADIQVKVGIF